ncbi:hypothetical protein DFH06DRAFT_1347737 [Mycena polygramma]|nr:hypothetical protein DFH06DRAFT_1347737 [Mycena polygramma]
MSLNLQSQADVSSLPPTLRPLGRLVANGDPSALNQVLQLIRTGTSQSHRFIPALTRALNVETIQQLPDSFDVDDPIWSRTQALDCLAALPEIPLQYCGALWPAVWAWTQLLYANRKRFPRPDSNGRDLCTTFLLIAGHLARHPHFAETIIHTPGIGVVLGHAWVVLLDDQDAPQYGEVYLQLCTLVRHWGGIRGKNSPHEWVQGFAGSQSETGTVFLNHVKRYLHAPISRSSESAAWFLGTAVIFLAKCRQFNEKTMGSDAHFSKGVVTALTNIICRLAGESPGRSVDQTLGFAIISLSSEFLRPHSYPIILETVRTGLVLGILRCSRYRDPDPDSIDIRVQDILEMISAALTHYPILREMEHSLPEVRRLLATTRFTTSKTSKSWHKYVDVMDSRLAVKKLYDSQEHISLKACDSIACGKIQPKSKLLRCSSCQVHFYCGLECQTADWKDGHRKNCAALRLRLGSPDYISIRNRSFLRAVFHADYLKYQVVILLVQLKYLIQHSPEAEFYTLFTYKNAIVRFNVHPTSELAPRWAYEAGRAARSEGRIEMQLVSVSEDEDTDWPRYFPLQSSNGMLQARLRHLAAQIRQGKQLDWYTEVKALIEATADKNFNPRAMMVDDAT